MVTPVQITPPRPLQLVLTVVALMAQLVIIPVLETMECSGQEMMTTDRKLSEFLYFSYIKWLCSRLFGLKQKDARLYFPVAAMFGWLQITLKYLLWFLIMLPLL